MVKMFLGYPLRCSTKIDSGAGLHGGYTQMDKLRDFIETLTEQECHELYKMLKAHLEEEVVFVAGPPEPLVEEEDYEVMPPA